MKTDHSDECCGDVPALVMKEQQNQEAVFYVHVSQSFDFSLAPSSSRLEILPEDCCFVSCEQATKAEPEGELINVSSCYLKEFFWGSGLVRGVCENNETLDHFEEHLQLFV